MNFNLQNPCFSESEEEEEDLLVPSNEMIKEYNREYSMIVGEIERFLKEVKDSVQRFVAFHNFGINLSLPALLNNLLTTDHLFKAKLAQAENGTSPNDPKLAAKARYEVSFNRLIQKMGELLKEFIDCELEFKKKYFGFQQDQKEERTRKLERVRTLSPQNYSISSITNSSKSSKAHIQHYVQAEQKEEKREAELRLMLNERLQPKAAAVQIECKPEYSTTENLYRLNEKIDRMFDEMKTVKAREEKLIELFNLNRVKKIHAPCEEEELPPFPSTDVSAIAPSEQDEVDSFLEGCRPAMKDLDAITEQGYHPKNRSFAKRSPTMLLAEFIE